MENYRFKISSNKIPEELRSYFVGSCRFWPVEASFFLSLGVGIIKLRIESKSDYVSQERIQKLDDRMNKGVSACGNEQNVLSDFNTLIKSSTGHNEGPNSFSNLTEIIKKDKHFLYVINYATRAIIASDDQNTAESIFSSSFDIRNSLNMVDSLCRALKFQLMVFFSDKHRVFGDCAPGPLMTIYETDTGFSLFLPQTRQIEAFPNVFSIPQEIFTFINNKYGMQVQGVSLRLVELLIKGFNPIDISEKNEMKLSSSIGTIIDDSEQINTINNILNISSRSIEMYRCVCKSEHSVDALRNIIYKGYKKCPCGVKFSPKNIDEILKRPRLRNNQNSIKNKVIPKNTWKDKTARKLNCNHIGIDPFSCNKHEFCLDCRYIYLDKTKLCSSCNRNLSISELTEMIDMISTEKRHLLSKCPICKRLSAFYEKQVCVYCGVISN